MKVLKSKKRKLALTKRYLSRSKNLVIHWKLICIDQLRFYNFLRAGKSLHEKPYFLFPHALKRWSFQKNCTGIWSFLYYQERWYFFFPKIWSYYLEGKWKMIFLKKIHKNIFKCSEKIVFPKIVLEYDLSCIFWKDGIFSRKYFFSLDDKFKMIFLKKYMGM